MITVSHLHSNLCETISSGKKLILIVKIEKIFQFKILQNHVENTFGLPLQFPNTYIEDQNQIIRNSK